jgi:DNA-binding CsgD family transcriptional regulator
VGGDARARPGPGPTGNPLPRSALVDAYILRGLSSNAVAKELGCSSQKVRDDLRHHGIPVRPRHSSKLEALGAKELEELYVDRQLTLAQVADACGCSASAVKNQLERLGIARRAPGWRPSSRDPVLSAQALTDLYVAQGLSILVIARRLDVSPDVVTGALDAHRIPRRPRGKPRPPLDEEVLRRLWLEEWRGESEVAAALGVSREWVRHELARHRIRRPRGQPRELPPPGPEVLTDLYVRRHLGLEQTAAQLGCSKHLVIKGLRQAGIPVRSRPNSSPVELRREELEDLYVCQGLSIGAVSTTLGAATDRVRQALRSFGIPIRRSGARQVDPPSIPTRTLKRLYTAEGLSMPEIAARYNTTTNQVRQLLRSQGIRRPPQSPPAPAPPPREVLEELFVTEGLSAEVIARRLRTSAPRVRAWLRASGIPVQPRTTRATRQELRAAVLEELYVRKELTIDEVAHHLQTTAIVVRRSLHAHGLAVRQGGPRPGRRGGPVVALSILGELYADPDVVALLRRHLLPLRAGPGPLAERFPDPIRPSRELLRDAYEGVGLAAGHIELLTGQPADQVLDALHRAGIAVRHASGASPWRRRLQIRVRKPLVGGRG